MSILTIQSMGNERMSYRSANLPYGLWYFVEVYGAGDTYTNWHSKTFTYDGLYRYDHFENNMWFRCQVNVPQGTVLTNVFFKVYGYTNNMNCTNTLPYRFYAVATDNCPAPTPNNYPVANDGSRYNNQTLTTAYVSWDPSRPAYYMSGEEIILPDFGPIFNEVLARPGWVSGNYIGITAKITGINETDNFYTPYTQLVGVRGPSDANPALRPQASYDEVPPPDPPVASIVGGINENTISWTTVPEATSYNIYWSYVPGVTTSDTKIAGVTSPYDHTGLDAGIAYYYIVTSEIVEFALESEPSNEVSAIPRSPENTKGDVIW